MVRNPNSYLTAIGRTSRLILAICTAAVAITAFIGMPQTAHADSSLGGSISRSEILTRAQDWYSQNVPYCTYDKTTCANSGTPWAWDLGHTRQYRPDCSGFVDMAWHLNADPNTAGLDDSTWTTPIAKTDLLPGDILDNVADGHVVLFASWYDSAHTEAWYYAEGSTATDMNYEHDPVNSGTLAGHPAGNYHAYRYKKIMNDAQFGDLTGDGQAELMNVRPDGKVITYRNYGWSADGGMFQANNYTTAYTFPAGTNPSSIMFSDITGDGQAELMNVRSDGKVIAYRNYGWGAPGGMFQTNNYTTAYTFPAGTNPSSIMFADLTGDGQAELMNVRSDARVTAYRNYGWGADGGMFQTNNYTTIPAF
jgi:hypothetical protein